MAFSQILSSSGCSGRLLPPSNSFIRSMTLHLVMHCLLKATARTNPSNVMNFCSIWKTKQNLEFKWLRGILSAYVDRRLVPPNQLGLDFVRIENRDRATVTHAAGSLDGTASALLDRSVNASQAIVMESCEVKLSDITSIVHVTNKDVHVVCGANT